MPLFDPHTIAAASGHFIGGRLVADTMRLAVLRPSDGQTHAELPAADAIVNRFLKAPGPLA